MKEKSLTFEQRQKFKKLYLADYSCTMIFKELGFDITPQQAVAKMQTYRKSMNLPKRSEGYKPKVSKVTWYFDHQDERKQLDRIRRIEKLNDMISRYESKLNAWKVELTSLTQQQSSKEAGT
jgi:hypothetical protein